LNRVSVKVLEQNRGRRYPLADLAGLGGIARPTASFAGQDQSIKLRATEVQRRESEDSYPPILAARHRELE
jgi:hypothetical protein